MKKSLLILALDHDIHADAIHDCISRRGYTSYRINTDLDWASSENDETNDIWTPAAKLVWSLSTNSHAASLSWYDQNIDLTKVGAVFCRSFEFPEPAHTAPIEHHLRYAEMKAGLSGVLKALGSCFWMNRPWVEDFIDNKMVQGLDAQKFGLSIPKTLVTNSQQKARLFIEQCENGAIIKQLSEVGLIDETPETFETYGFYTSLVTKDDMEHLHEVAHAPCLFQEAIEKKADIRVTVVGDKIFAHRIESQSKAQSIIDFRREPELVTEPFNFPEETGAVLLKLLKHWGIEFAACDFALTPNDELIFFEANVTGNWLWLEDTDHHPIIDEIVAKLAGNLD